MIIKISFKNMSRIVQNCKTQNSKLDLHIGLVVECNDSDAMLSQIWLSLFMSLSFISGEYLLFFYLVTTHFPLV